MSMNVRARRPAWLCRIGCDERQKAERRLPTHVLKLSSCYGESGFDFGNAT